MGTTMLVTSQIKVGSAFMYNNAPLIVQKMLGQRSGRAGMVTNLRVKNLVTGSTMDLGLDAGEKFDEVDLQTHTTKLSYIDGEGDGANYVFMDQETFDEKSKDKADSVTGINISDIADEDALDEETQLEVEIMKSKGSSVSYTA